MRFLFFLSLLFSLLFSESSMISMQELNKLTALDGAGSDNFGDSVSISGDIVVVGAPSDDDLGDDSGSAYIYKRNATTGLFEQVAKLTASDGADGDRFASSVAISGDTIVVGAHGHATIGSDSGSAYIYERNTTTGLFEQVAKLTASDGAAYDYLGFSVAISGDTIVVGAYGDEDSGMYSGSAYLYKKPDTGWADSYQTTKLKASDGAAFDRFSYEISISGDTVVVGSPYDDDSGSASGSAYIYERNTTTGLFEQVAKLKASDGADNDNFGISVSISGDTVLVGAYGDDDLGDASGSAYLYKKPDTGWADSNQTAKLTASDGADGDRFSHSVAISGDTIVVGAYIDGDLGDASGSAYIYERNTTSLFEQVAKLTASDGAAYDYFGFSVAISGDTVVVGAEADDTDTLGDDSGSAYVFKAKQNAVYPAIIMYLLN